MLAYYVEWHMRRALAPLLFEEDDPQTAEALRASVVAPAERSPRARRKNRRKRNDEGLPVQSFSDLLADTSPRSQRTSSSRQMLPVVGSTSLAPPHRVSAAPSSFSA